MKNILKRALLIALSVLTFVGAVPFGDIISYNPFSLTTDTHAHEADSQSVSANAGELESGIPGDINGDIAVSIGDALHLAKHIAGWDVRMNSPASDTNGDGIVNSIDILHLAKYIAKWDVDVYCGDTVTISCNHSMVEIPMAAASCEAPGNITYYVCEKCDRLFLDQEGTQLITLADTVIDPLMHSDGRLTVVEEPTCEKDGRRMGSCTNCGRIVDETIPALGHVEGGIVGDETDICNGHTVGKTYCERCGEVVSIYGHDYVRQVIQPTCIEDGRVEYTCTQCGQSYFEAIATTGHLEGEWVTTVEATCTAQGVKILSCESCGTVLDTTATDLISHSYVDTVTESEIIHQCQYCPDSYSEAIGEESVCIIDFVTDRGASLPSMAVISGDELDLPIPETEEYDFDGWYMDQELDQPFIDKYITEDITLYAKWDINTLVSEEVIEHDFESEVPLDYAFDVVSPVPLDNGSLGSYVQVIGPNGESVEIAASSNGDGTYRITASSSYEAASNYHVFTANGVTVKANGTQEFVFITGDINHENVVFNSDVIFVNKAELAAAYTKEETEFIELYNDLANVGSTVAIFEGEKDNIVAAYKIVTEFNNGVNAVYTVIPAEYDDLFESVDIYYSGKLDMGNFVPSEELIANVTEQFVNSPLYYQIQEASKLYAAQNSNAKYTYLVTDPKFEPNVKIEDGNLIISFKASVKFKVIDNQANKEIDPLVITLNIKNTLDLDFVSDYENLGHFNFVLKVKDTFNIKFLVSSTTSGNQKKDEELEKFKKLFYEISESGKLEKIKKDAAVREKEILLGTAFVGFGGLTVGVELSHVFRYEAVGEMGTELKVVWTAEAGISRNGWFDGIDCNKSSSVETTITSYLMGKVKATYMLRFEVYFCVVGCVKVGFDVSAGPYAEVAGIIKTEYNTHRGLNIIGGGYFQVGIQTEGYGRVTVLGKEIATLKVFEQEFPIFTVGSTELIIGFQNKEGTVDVSMECGEYLDLSNVISKDIAYQDLKSMEVKITNEWGVVYNLKESSKYVKLNRFGILELRLTGSLPEVIPITVIVSRGDLEKYVDVNITVNHDPHNYSYIEPTCIHLGREEHVKCDRCNRILYGEDKFIPALDHEFTRELILEQTKRTDATCTVKESYWYSCIRCDSHTQLDYFEVGELLPHEYLDEYTCHDRYCIYCNYYCPATTEHVYTDWIEIEGGVCSPEPYFMRACTDCGHYELTIDETLVVHHQFGEFSKIEPTCENEGSLSGVCIICGYAMETQVIPALAHKFQSSYDENSHYEYCVNHGCGLMINAEEHTLEEGEATCIKGICCTVCKNEVIPRLGHDLSVYVDKTEATCTESGKEAHLRCSRCMFTYGATIIPFLGHDYQEEWTWNEDGSVSYLIFCKNDPLDSYSGTVKPIKSTKNPTCTEEGTHKYTARVNVAGMNFEDVKTEAILPLGHDYSDVEFGEWNLDFTDVEVSKVCSHNNSHVIELEEVITSEVVVAATCGNTGLKRYTASVYLDGMEYTATEDKVLPCKNHEWAEPTWKWANNYNTAKCTTVCKTDPEHSLSFTVTAKEEIITKPSCYGKGEKKYTVSAYLSGVAYTDEMIVPTDAAGHNYACRFEWAEDHKSAKLIAECRNDSKHNGELTVTAKEEILRMPTCSRAGKIEYTVSAIWAGKKYTDTYAEEYTVDTPAHEYEASWTLSENNEEVTLKLVCKNEGKNGGEYNLDTDIHTVTEATCTKNKVIRVTASYEHEGVVYTYDENVSVINTKLGHDYTELWSWDDEYNATLTLSCSRDPEHNQVFTEKGELVQILDETCTEEGVALYRVTVKTDDGSYTDDSAEFAVPATGHNYPDEPVWVFNDDHTDATASFRCGRCQNVIEADSTTVEILSYNPAKCEEAGELTYSGEAAFGDKVYTKKETKVLEAIGHTYIAPTEDAWTWADDFKGATATVVCSNSEDCKPYTMEATVSSVVRNQAGCEENGEKEYTAAVIIGEASYKSKRTEAIPAKGHAYNLTWNWDAENVSFTCENDSSHNCTVPAQVTSETVTEPTCLTKGETKYIGVCTDKGVTYTETATVKDIAALGHDYEDTWSWNEDNTSTVTLVCSRDSDHVITKNFDAKVTEATCTEDGKVKYVTQCVIDGVEYGTEDSVEIVLPALGHSYKAPSTDEEEDGDRKNFDVESAAAIFKCERCGDEVTVDCKSLEMLSSVDSTCGAQGSISMRAMFEFESREYVYDYTIKLPKLPHDWNEPTWTWDGYDSAKASFVCKNDESHTTFIIDTHIEKEKINATCFENSVTTYTAKVKITDKYGSEVEYTGQKQSVGNDVLEHEYEAQPAVWYDGNTVCEFVFQCKHDESGNHIIKEKVKAELISTNATCTEDGKNTYTAEYEFEGTVYTEEYAEIAEYCFGHDYEAGWEWNDFDSAVLTLTCKNDNSHVIIKNVALVSKTITEVTCEQDGLVEYIADMTVDGNHYKDEPKQKIIPALGHDWADEWTQGSSTHYYVCNRKDCSAKKDESAHNSLYEVITEEKQDGDHITYIHRLYDICSVCEKKHELISEVATMECVNVELMGEYVPATCETDGLMPGLWCPDCEVIYEAEEVIPATGHKYSQWIDEVLATCTHEGNVGHYECLEPACGCNFDYNRNKIENVVIPKRLHMIVRTDEATGEKTYLPMDLTKAYLPDDYPELVLVGAPATCTAEGKAAFTCGSCSQVITGVKILGSHAYEWNHDETQHWQYCSTCSDEADRGDHDLINGTCQTCGYVKYKTSEGLEFTLSYDKTYYSVTGIGTCTDTELVIPDTHEGLPVREIGDCAFEDCSQLISITIFAGVTDIGNAAFRGCLSLTNIKIPNSVTNFGHSVFWNCSSLTSIIIPDSVTSIGAYSFYNCSSLKCVNIPDGVSFLGWGAFMDCSSLTNIVLGKGITSIASMLFYRCTSLNSVEISNGVTIIYLSAFEGCSQLSSVNIPDSVTSIDEKAFYGCSNLINIEIPDSVISIGESAFYCCSSLTSIVIPDSVTSIGNAAFWDCSSLTSIVIGDSVTSIGNSAFRNCSSLESVVIGNSVTSIGSSAFSYCSSLTSVVIPDSVTSIYGGTFFNCSSLTSIVIPDSVTSIGSSAFSYCSSLTSINIPDSVTIIYDGAFSDCSSLTSIVIPDGVTSIGEDAFSGCTSLASIDIPDSVTSIGNYAFSGCSSFTSIVIPDSVTSIGNSAFGYCSNLTSIVIPDGVASIGNYAFCDCSSLTSIVIPDSVTSIGNYAFYRCSSLTSIVIGDSVTSIGEVAFSYCSSLTNVVIPDSVTSIGNSAFRNCSSLESIVIGNGVTSIGNSAFLNCLSLTSVVIGDSVTSIGVEAFIYCYKLSTLYYGGTPTEWEALVPNIGSNNTKLTNATRHYYSEAMPTDTEYSYWRYVDEVPTVWDENYIM